jgi:hypothetical protein
LLTGKHVQHSFFCFLHASLFIFFKEVISAMDINERKKFFLFNGYKNTFLFHPKIHSRI